MEGWYYFGYIYEFDNVKREAEVHTLRCCCTSLKTKSDKSSGNGYRRDALELVELGNWM